MNAPNLCLAMLLAACVLSGCRSAPERRTAVADRAELLMQADAQYAAGQAEAAAVMYLEALRDDPDQAELWVRLGNAYARAERPSDAARAYEQAVARDPSRAQSWFNLGVVLSRQAQDAFARAASRSVPGQAVETEGRRMQRALSDALMASDRPASQKEQGR